MLNNYTSIDYEIEWWVVAEAIVMYCVKFSNTRNYRIVLTLEDTNDAIKCKGIRKGSKHNVNILLSTMKFEDKRGWTCQTKTNYTQSKSEDSINRFFYFFVNCFVENDNCLCVYASGLVFLFCFILLTMVSCAFS